MTKYHIVLVEKIFYELDLQAKNAKEAREKAITEYEAGNYQETGENYVEVDSAVKI